MNNKPSEAITQNSNDLNKSNLYNLFTWSLMTHHVIRGKLQEIKLQDTKFNNFNHVNRKALIYCKFNLLKYEII